MLPRKRRISRGAGPKGAPLKNLSSAFFRVTVYPGRDRAAVLIGRRVSPLASARNRVKRRILALIEKTSLPDKDMIILVRPGATEASPGELRADLAALLSKLH